MHRCQCPRSLSSHAGGETYPDRDLLEPTPQAQSRGHLWPPPAPPVTTLLCTAPRPCCALDTPPAPCLSSRTHVLVSRGGDVSGRTRPPRGRWAERLSAPSGVRPSAPGCAHPTVLDGDLLWAHRPCGTTRGHGGPAGPASLRPGPGADAGP